MMELKEFTSPNQVNLFDILVVKERFATVAPQIEVSNFLLGAAYCGNDRGSLIGGLDDSRNRLTKEQKGRIVLDALQQLITLTTRAKNDPIVTAQEQARLLNIAASLIEMCNDSQQTGFYRLPSFEIPKEARQAIDKWGHETCGEEWTRATDKTFNSWFIKSFPTMANKDYLGIDFVAHCICAIRQNAISPPADFSKPWDDISFLRAFWQQHRPPTTLDRLLNKVPKSPYVSNLSNLPTYTTQIYK